MKRLIAIVLLASLLLAGCVSRDNTDTSDAVTFTDALGRSVSVKRSPERVAALIGSFADVWTLSGGKLCAAASDAEEDFGIDLSDAVNIGGAHSPSLELLLSSMPELVLASASTASNVKLKDTLEAAGITVAYFDVDCFEDYLDMLRICTEITGRDDLYRKNGLEIKERIDAIKEELSLKVPDSGERTVLLLRASSSSVKAKGSAGTVLGEMLSDLGCVNIADRDGSLLETLSIESIMASGPRHIFVVTMGDNEEAARASLERLINENPAWSTLDAIKDDRLHIMDKTLFNLKPNDRWAEAYEILKNILYETE